METTEPARAGESEDGRGALADLIDDPSSRKKFLRMVGGAGAASAFATLASACGQRDVPIGIAQNDPGSVAQFGPGDSGIVNFALFSEYLENEFYERIIEGDEVTDDNLRDLYKDILGNEQEHQRALEEIAEQIGRPVRKPKADFSKVFAGGQEKILSFSATLENLGAAAYLGQAARIQDRMVLAAALTIHTVEARHAAALNELAGRTFRGKGNLRGKIPNGAFARPMTMDETLKAFRPYMASGIPKLKAPGD
jgi:rubrerythrin